MPEVLTERSRAKADRRDALLTAATRLFAERGFASVSIEDLGASVGVSGPAVYRHFAGKQAVLAAILRDASTGLLDGGTRVVDDAADTDSALAALIRFHVDFALANADVILVQDRDMSSLSETDRHDIRRLQRRYVETWVGVLARLRPDQAESELRIRAHAAFGLLNSTPHSARVHGRAPADRVVRKILEDMAWRSLTS
ncbi:TetR/AcrR family transcriptional regulator [Agromyces atrinae]|uniref:AcrR family transcriptional regulator n=1 Tax=Agromyces atrinae TaxID=592376 RepID=A0A4Q2M8I0_9MICO|nr:TetR/AcrR family transcriptional regulator [Agromyces atrinae]MCI2958942.1 TetR/AcrR family transcriptional regulator [Agromyces atrinae]NYD65831.1 AcrR family transcriptional regulator [Agromyces atrinae]RXZ86182.1 TetR/AcrR family transcriptional regulator [Agromyces atrinae]